MGMKRFTPQETRERMTEALKPIPMYIRSSSLSDSDTLRIYKETGVMFSPSVIKVMVLPKPVIQGEGEE